jgi:hypothetical protein
MASKRRTLSPALPTREPDVGKERTKPAKPAKAKPRAPEPAHEPRASAMQRAFGNHAVQRYLRALQEKGAAATAADRLKPPLNRVAAWLEQAAAADGKHDLLNVYFALTLEQKRAALEEMVRRSGGVFPLLSAGPDWEMVEDCLNLVREVKLEPNEVETEGVEEDPTEDPKRDEEGADAPGGLAGMLPPYSDILYWLNYKARRQAKTAVMEELLRLSAPQKKWVLHHVARGRKKLDLKSFSEAVSVRIKWKTWVDWETLQAAIRQAKAMKFDGLAPRAQQAIIEHAKAEAESPARSREEDEGADWLGFVAAAAGAAALAHAAGGEDGEKASGKGDGFDWQDAGRIGWLLTGQSGAADPAEAIRAFLAAPGDWTGIVDRYLRLAGKAEAGMRERALKERGFADAQQCLKHIAQELARLIHEKAVVQRDPAYVRLLASLNLAPGAGGGPTPAQIAEALANRILHGKSKV